jgi:hypothetical protein
MNKLNLHVLDNKINLYNFDINYKKDIILVLIQYLLPNKDIFLSMTINDNEISLICDSFIEEYIKDINYIVLKNYNCIKICDDFDNINYVGIVKHISNLLAQINIPILYINSFNNNYIIIENINVHQAIEHLQNNFIIT